jgi:hypothetical protein
LFAVGVPAADSDAVNTGFSAVPELAKLTKVLFDVHKLITPPHTSDQAAPV